MAAYWADAFRAQYQRYLVDNLGEEIAAEYIARFPAQLEAPTHRKGPGVRPARPAWRPRSSASPTATRSRC